MPAPSCFNPRAPRGARLGSSQPWPRGKKFQSTRPARGATKAARHRVKQNPVSIHAPRAGRDFSDEVERWTMDCFNPRAPRGARPTPTDWVGGCMAFQSTRPARGATDAFAYFKYLEPVSIHAPRAGRDAGGSATTAARASFNPRAPRGARPQRIGGIARTTSFNPRAPRGARPTTAIRRSLSPVFQSTRPARGATAVAGEDGLRADCFNPRAPRGARRRCRAMPALFKEFQSTRPARGATPRRERDVGRTHVSIHAPRAGRDGKRVSYICGKISFNPRAPRGARLR